MSYASSPESSISSPVPRITVVAVPTPARITEKEQIFHDGLTEHLLFALPLAMKEVHRMPSYAKEQLRAKAAAAVGSRGDVLQFQHKKHTAEAGRQLDVGLAYLALMTPGGITRFGVHACATPHDDCPAHAEDSNQAVGTT